MRTAHEWDPARTRMGCYLVKRFNVLCENSKYIPGSAWARPAYMSRSLKNSSAVEKRDSPRSMMSSASRIETRDTA